MNTEHLPLRVRANLALSAKCALSNWQHREAWKRIEARIHEQAPKGAKVFEVHHVIETARNRYFEALVAGESPEDCEAQCAAIGFAG